MPSPRSSPALRPQSPLSPRYEPSRLDALLAQTSTRSMQPRSPQRTGRVPNSSLRLPTLPRFHPANYPSAHSSLQSTPDDESAARAPLSPRTHQKMFSQAQKQLLQYQRDSLAARATSPLREKPCSPRLVPLRSPGPVTPLALESEDGEYLTAGYKTASTSVPSRELIEALIQREAAASQMTAASRSAR